MDSPWVHAQVQVPEMNNNDEGMVVTGVDAVAGSRMVACTGPGLDDALLPRVQRSTSPLMPNVRKIPWKISALCRRFTGLGGSPRNFLIRICF